MNNLPGEAIGILAGVAIVALLWLALRFGRQVVRVFLVVGILALGVILALAFLTQAGANRATAKAVQVATVGQSISMVVLILALGATSAVTIGALGVAGLFWLRWRLAERRRQLPRRQRGQRALPSKDAPEIVYILEDEAAPVDLDGLDLEAWGW